MNTPLLKAGTSLDIVFESEIMKSDAHYMKATVYDYDNDKLTISQTTPALTRYFLDRKVIVTFLFNNGRKLLRFGFPARLVDLITDYKLVSQKEVDALVLKANSDPEPLDFRMYFRVKPGAQTALSLLLKEVKVNLIDISLGGAKFTYSKKDSFRPGDALKMDVIIGNTTYHLYARVHEAWTPAIDYSVNRNIQYVSVAFSNLDKQLEVTLGRAIIDIERGLLSEGKF
jgi:hypothetical protein